MREDDEDRHTCAECQRCSRLSCGDALTLASAMHETISKGMVAVGHVGICPDGDDGPWLVLLDSVACERWEGLETCES
jgi:hypothetical protein